MISGPYIHHPDNCCDLSKLYAFSEGNNEFILEILSLYIRHSPQEMNLLKEALECEDLTQAGRVAHKLKSSTSLLGNPQLTSKLNTIEVASLKNGSIDEARAVWPEIQDMQKKMLEEVSARAALLMNDSGSPL